ncbi:MAG: MBL fold metallo-hydrolase [Bacteroidales bacterium]|nr:MBL fold metallo-hydrolase [Bacteroidales bacterium]
MELKIKVFNFNMIQVNTLVLYDDTKEAVIVDPGMGSFIERQELTDFVEENALEVKYILCTHPHIDHVLGNGFCVSTFKAPLLMHEAGLGIYNHSIAYGAAFGLDCDKANFPDPDQYMKEGDVIRFGHQELQVLDTPGHADGSVCLYVPAARCVIVGDILFAGSIGRTDLPTGNHKMLIENLKTKILTLPDDTMVYTGHGPITTIGEEKRNNPFLRN